MTAEIDGEDDLGAGDAGDAGDHLDDGGDRSIAPFPRMPGEGLDDWSMSSADESAGELKPPPHLTDMQSKPPTTHTHTLTHTHARARPHVHTSTHPRRTQNAQHTPTLFVWHKPPIESCMSHI